MLSKKEQEEIFLKRKEAEREGQSARVRTPIKVDPTFCLHRGKETGETKQCPSCSGTVHLKVFSCAVHQTCTISRRIEGVSCCVSCPDRKPKAQIRPAILQPAVPSTVIKEWNHTNFFPQLAGYRFNPGMTEWKDGYAFAWRDGWAGSNIWICELNKQFSPISQPKKLELTHKRANWGREDPRLFVFRDKLHVSFIGVVGRNRKVTQTHQLYARLGPNYDTEQIFAPNWPGVPSNRWQKNHLLHQDRPGGDLYAIYSLSPLKVAKLNGERAEWVSEAPGIPWEGGEPRGGAPPVRVGDELWVWMHDRFGSPSRYRTGLVTLDAKPPFAFRRIIPRPVLFADLDTKPTNQYIAVTFVGASVRVGDDWITASGTHDRHITFHKYRHEDLEKALIPQRAVVASTNPMHRE